MEIVLGVSMTTTTVRMVLVEGEKADGVTIESGAFDTAAADGVPRGSPSEQVSAAILATQQSALSSGHHLVVSGVTWIDEPASASLRDSIAARGLDNVVLVSEQHAAGALAQTVGRALGYDTTAVILLKPGTATLSIVNSADGSIVEARTLSLDSIEATEVLPEMVALLKAADSRPQGVFVVGSDMDVRSVKANLESLISQPVIVPEEPELALARGAALAAGNAPGFEASTCGLAYSQDPDTTAAGRPVKLSDADTEAAPIDCGEIVDGMETGDEKDRRRLLMPVGSLVAGTFVVGAVALVMSLAVSIRPTDQGSIRTEQVTVPSDVAAAPPIARAPAPVQAPPAAAAAPAAAQAQPLPPPPPAPPISLPDPAAVVAQASSAVPVEAPAAKVPAPAPVAADPDPPLVVPAPAPVAVEKPLTAAPVAVDPPVPEAAPPPAPIAVPMPAPEVRPVPQTPPAALPRFSAPSLWIGAPAAPQQASQPQQGQQWWQIPLGPQQQPAQPPQQMQPGLHIDPWPQRQTPQAPQWTPPQQAPQWTPPQQAPQWTPPQQAPQWTPPQQAPQWTPPQQAPQWTPPPLYPQRPQIPPTQRSPWQQGPYGSASSGSVGPAYNSAGGFDGSTGGRSSSRDGSGDGSAPWWALR
jgi:hypothetical protein